jgi:hypothetical protein
MQQYLLPLSFLCFRWTKEYFLVRLDFELSSVQPLFGIDLIVDKKKRSSICNHSVFLYLGGRKNQSENQSDVEEKSPEAAGEQFRSNF